MAHPEVGSATSGQILPDTEGFSECHQAFNGSQMLAPKRGTSGLMLLRRDLRSA
jgi:hypothetical protein